MLGLKTSSLAIYSVAILTVRLRERIGFSFQSILFNYHMANFNSENSIVIVFSFKKLNISFMFFQTINWRGKMQLLIMLNNLFTNQLVN
jgi:hypothetical protein